MLRDDPGPDATDSVKVSHAPNQLGDRYQLRDLLGEGGWGQVYRAFDLKLKEEIAIKILRSSLSTTPGEIERFKREIITARKITHPNVIRIHEYGEAGPDVYISMELLEGGTLADRLKDGPLPIADALRLGAELAEGLQAAHARDIIHRDIKPHNVMFDEVGKAKLVDFGIARLQGTQTQTQGFTGTPFYMSPEQADGSQITSASDIYSLGVVLFEMFTGQLPFKSDSLVRMALLHSAEKPPRPRSLRSDIPDFVEDIILRCLEKKPEHRPASARELANALRAALNALESGNKPVPVLRPRKRRPIWPFVAGGVLLIGAAGAGGVKLLLSPEETPVPSETTTAVVGATTVTDDATPVVTRKIVVVTATVTVTPTPRAVRTHHAVKTPKPVEKGTVSVAIRPFGYWTLGRRKVQVNSVKDPGRARIPEGTHTITLHDNRSGKETTVTVHVCAGQTTTVKWIPGRGAPKVHGPGGC